MRALVLLVALVALAPLAAAAREYEGDILVGHPLTQSPVQSINGRLHPCDVDSPTNGLDGVWFDGADMAGLTATLTMDFTLDVDLYFWTEACAFDGTFGCAMNFSGTTETCIVPAGTRWLSVEGWSGTGHFRLVLE